MLREIAVAHPQHTMLVVSHADMIRQFLIHASFATEAQLGGGSISNTGYAVVESDGIDFSIKEAMGISIKQK